MRASLGWPCLLLGSLLARTTAAAPAEQETATLRWMRAEGAMTCPSENDVAQAIEQRLGRAAFVPSERASLLVEAQLDARPEGGFRVDIALKRGETVVGRRELESADASCQGVAESAALVIALTIDPEASFEPLPIAAAPPVTEPEPIASPPPVAAPEKKQSAPAPAPPPLPAPPPKAEPWHAELELAGSVASGSLPNGAPALHVKGRALPPALPFAVELEAAYFPSERIDAQPSKGGDFTMFYGGAALCSRMPRQRRLLASLCAGGQLGTLTGRGFGFADTPAFRTWTFALAARGVLGFRVRPPLMLVAGPSLTLPLKRDYFETTSAAGTQRLFRLSALGIGFELGAVFEL